MVKYKGKSSVEGILDMASRLRSDPELRESLVVQCKAENSSLHGYYEQIIQIEKWAMQLKAIVNSGIGKPTLETAKGAKELKQTMTELYWGAYRKTKGCKLLQDIGYL